MIPPIIVVCQLSLEAINAPAPLCSSNVGLANGLGIPNCVSSGPIARMITLFGPRALNNKTANHHVRVGLNKAAGTDVTKTRTGGGSQIVHLDQSNSSGAVYATQDRGVVARLQVCNDRRFARLSRSVADCSEYH